MEIVTFLITVALCFYSPIAGIFSGWHIAFPGTIEEATAKVENLSADNALKGFTSAGIAITGVTATNDHSFGQNSDTVNYQVAYQYVADNDAYLPKGDYDAAYTVCAVSRETVNDCGSASLWAKDSIMHSKGSTLKDGTIQLSGTGFADNVTLTIADDTGKTVASQNVTIPARETVKNTSSVESWALQHGIHVPAWLLGVAVAVLGFLLSALYAALFYFTDRDMEAKRPKHYDPYYVEDALPWLMVFMAEAVLSIVFFIGICFPIG